MEELCLGYNCCLPPSWKKHAPQKPAVHLCVVNFMLEVKAHQGEQEADDFCCEHGRQKTLRVMSSCAVTVPKCVKHDSDIILAEIGRVQRVQQAGSKLRAYRLHIIHCSLLPLCLAQRTEASCSQVVAPPSVIQTACACDQRFQDREQRANRQGRWCLYGAY